MKRATKYHTKQGKAILEYLSTLHGAHVTVEDIARHFQSQGIPIGLTTIYRNLDKLLADGTIRKYIIDPTLGACYQLVDSCSDEPDHFHLMCEVCGTLTHLQCHTLEQLSSHVAQEHTFYINLQKTLFYGICQQCATQ